MLRKGKGKSHSEQVSGDIHALTPRPVLFVL